ncbi:WhiB family transcriptional regulator [Streptomyces sp. JHA19]|uniref:WhiB family transcriptional regulator n=1 Tax=Streptomyces sp. JHA19 TaxID=1577588 RepID=UPI000D14C183
MGVGPQDAAKRVPVSTREPPPSTRLSGPDLQEEVGLVNPDTPCREQPDLLVDASRTTPLKKKTTAAKALCTHCPLSDACTDYAIANEPSRSSSRAA